MRSFFIRHPLTKFGFAIGRIRHKPKTLYLSFDDGPEPLTTFKILEILKKYNAKATFFCLGEKAEKFKYIVDIINEEGHSIGNHGYHHLNSFKVNNKKWIHNMQKESPVSISYFYRPPYGKILPWQIYQLKNNRKLILWDVLTYDFTLEYSVNDVKRIIKKYVRDGSIIVFHDNIFSAPRMIPSLEFTLQYFGRKGYSFDRINL